MGEPTPLALSGDREMRSEVPGMGAELIFIKAPQFKWYKGDACMDWRESNDAGTENN